MKVACHAYMKANRYPWRNNFHCYDTMYSIYDKLWTHWTFNRNYGRHIQYTLCNTNIYMWTNITNVLTYCSIFIEQYSMSSLPRSSRWNIRLKCFVSHAGRRQKSDINVCKCRYCARVVMVKYKLIWTISHYTIVIELSGNCNIGTFCVFSFPNRFSII